MLNGLFAAAALLSILLAAFTGHMPALTEATLASARDAATLALGLTGVLALFMGLMRVAAEGGLLAALARAVSPLLRWLFPGIPDGHPALSAMVLNVSATVLGLGNAATPFGIKAMTELDRLNGEKGTATDAMVLFLAINTSGVTLIPTTVLALRADQGSTDPAAILLPTWIASLAATAVAVAAAWGLSRLPRFRRTAPAAADARRPTVAATSAAATSSEEPSDPPDSPLAAGWPTLVDPRANRRRRALIAAALALAFAVAMGTHLARGGTVRDLLSFWTLPALVGGLVLFGWARGVRVYDATVEGAKEGFWTAVRILPYLVAIVTVIGMVRASGGLERLVSALAPAAGALGIPAEVLPVGLMRPLSSSGGLALLADTLKQYGPDGSVGLMASTIQGSSETTFYVLAVYFGAVGVRRTRHALPACLLADAASVLFAVWAVAALLS